MFFEAHLWRSRDCHVTSNLPLWLLFKLTSCSRVSTVWGLDALPLCFRLLLEQHLCICSLDLVSQIFSWSARVGSTLGPTTQAFLIIPADDGLVAIVF